MSESEAARGEDPSEAEWLTTGEAAAILSASLPTVRRMVDNGTLIAMRKAAWSSLGQDRLGRQLRGHRRVSRESVMAVKAARERVEREGAAVVENPPPDTLDT